MERLELKVDPTAGDPAGWGFSLLNNAELIVACLEAAEVRSVVEVGAFAGDLTRLLLEWAAGAQARVVAIDASPEEPLARLAEDRDDLELIRAMSHDALRTIPLPDAVIIDGDHNYYTVFNELTIIGERTDGPVLPLLMFHDVCWPHGRRDDYFDPEAIPAEHRHPTVDGGGLFPGVTGIDPGGLPYRHPAGHEGGPRNGVLTAIEDFVDGRDGLRLAVVPAFFGLGVVWHAEAPWAGALAEVIEPWDRNPLLERLEANRVRHLASMHRQHVLVNVLRERLARQDAVFHKLLESKTFVVGQFLSRLRQGGEPAYSKDEIRRVLGE
jgi:SAM-dependent methyltransferase